MTEHGDRSSGLPELEEGFMTGHGDRLSELPELEVPAALDALVLARACAELERNEWETPAPVVVPRAEALVYAAGLAAYCAYLARVMHGAIQIVFRMIAG